MVVAFAPHLFGQAPEVLYLPVDLGTGRPRSGAPRRRRRRKGNSPFPGLGARPGVCHRRVRGPPVGARPTAQAVPYELLEESLASVEHELGAPLSDEQREAAAGICASGRGAEIVVGVAGVGKTTMLRAVADVFERSGHEVFGTATSGQAASNLALEARIAGSRTLASSIVCDEGLAAYAEVVSRFGGDPAPAVRERVATAMFNKGVRLGRLGRGEEAVAAYDEVVSKFGDDPAPALREPVANALSNKGIALGKLGLSDDELSVYDEVVFRFGDDHRPPGA